MAEVAAEAGLSTGAVYTYVDSKEALLHLVLAVGLGTPVGDFHRSADAQRRSDGLREMARPSGLEPDCARTPSLDGSPWRSMTRRC